MSRTRTKTSHLNPATVSELLDYEEAMAIQGITATVQRLGTDILVATDVRNRIRRHPFLAVGIGACLGFVTGPFLLRNFKGILIAATTLPSRIPRPPHSLPGLVTASLSAFRARR